MSNLHLQLRGPYSARLGPHYQQPLDEILVDMGVLSRDEQLRLLAIQKQCAAPFHHVCLAEGAVSQKDLLRAQAAKWAALELSAEETPADPALMSLLDPIFCLEHGVLPWLKLGNTTVVATSRPDAFETLRAQFPETMGPVVMGVVTEEDIHHAIADAHAQTLTAQAETSVAEPESCRGMHVIATRRQMAAAGCAGLLFTTLILAFPAVFYGLAALWAAGTLIAVALMKGAACLARLTGPVLPDAAPAPPLDALPRMSILVPLFKETGIAETLVTRLQALTYPKSKLDVVLVLEADDAQTHDTLARTQLPPWMRTISVPGGTLTTKPRAMNYALNFCHGDIVGIYDAEDNPAPNQLETVAAQFAAMPPDVACLQGILDFYNPRANWLARCFTIEYASWFRIVLPGLAKMGFAIPLGGTTVFFRREVLIEVGGWDAHNVTEDADLGMRLSRRGYRTEMVETVTLEEANCRWWPWVRQRSRWLKGYMSTYRVHMRRPSALLRDLGMKRFIGFQVFFLGSLSQFVLAPVLWSLWLVVFGLPHPLAGWLPAGALWALTILFLLTEGLGLIIGAAAVSSPRHRHLMPWLPTLMFYFPLGSIAAYKALTELFRNPFYWDKTEHGHALGSATVHHD